MPKPSRYNGHGQVQAADVVTWDCNIEGHVIRCRAVLIPGGLQLSGDSNGNTFVFNAPANVDAVRHGVSEKMREVIGRILYRGLTEKAPAD